MKSSGLEKYQKKRDFEKTPEPKGRVAKEGKRRFVVQEHHASRLHFDFRLEMGGVLKSWAVPKGPSLDPRDKRLAMEVEDHPVEYLKFEGEIAEGNYGAGQVVVWDTGAYEPVGTADPLAAYGNGKLSFVLNGKTLHGQFNLVKMKGRTKEWLLIKSSDRFAEPGWKLELLVQDARAKPVRLLRAASRSKQAPAKKQAKRTRAKQMQLPAPAEGSITLDEFIASQHLRGDVSIDIQGKVVPLTSLDKLYWTEEGISKGELLQYYARVAPFILPYLLHRPLILKRYPNGIRAPMFFQHEFGSAPEFVRTESLESAEGRVIDYVIIDDVATLLYVTNLGTIEEHPWHSRVEAINSPDWVVFDLDPEGVEFRVVREVAQALGDVLDRLGLYAYPKTSGSRGMHVFVPIEPGYTYAQATVLAGWVAGEVVRENSDKATIVRSLAKREAGRVYVDHMQNAKGKTIAAPYSVRARPSAPVSTPVDWDEVKRDLDPREYTVRTVPARLGERGYLFRGVLDRRQSLDRALQTIEEMAGSSIAR